MYLIDTNVISETRKGKAADQGVRDFFRRAAGAGSGIYISVVTVGEISRGIELVRRRGDARQYDKLSAWMKDIVDDYRDNILPFDLEAASLWGVLRVPDPAHEIDKQIAAIAMVNSLTLVTRNTAHVAATGVDVLNPFTA